MSIVLIVLAVMVVWTGVQLVVGYISMSQYKGADIEPIHTSSSDAAWNDPRGLGE